MSARCIQLNTEDGVLDLYVFRPEEETGPWPAVILYMDAFGIRPQLERMAQRVASAGYFVALPNLYYRSGAFAPFDPHQVAADGPERDRFKGMIASLDGPKVMRDTSAVIRFLDEAREARSDRIAVVGYCMGGGYALIHSFPTRRSSDRKSVV